MVGPRVRVELSQNIPQASVPHKFPAANDVWESYGLHWLIWPRSDPLLVSVRCTLTLSLDARGKEILPEILLAEIVLKNNAFSVWSVVLGVSRSFGMLLLALPHRFSMLFSAACSLGTVVGASSYLDYGPTSVR